MASQIKTVFNQHCDGLKINRNFVKELHRLQVGFVNRNSDHVDFFGGALLGAHPVRYRTSDRQVWLNDLLEIEEDDIIEDIKKVPAVKEGWVRASDPVNLSCIWLLHQLHHASGLSARDKETAMIDVVLILQYKYVSSLMAHYFPYPTDKDLALATYAALTRKYDLKVYGSWGAMFHARAKQIVANNSIHYSTFTKLDDDGAIIYMVNDIQDRLKAIVKKMTKVFYQVRDSGMRISSTSAVAELDGGLEVKDQTRNSTQYIRYLHDIVSDRSTFVRSELIKVIADAMHTMPDKYLEEALTYCSKNYGVRGDKRIGELIDETLLHAFDYIHSQRGIMANPSDLPRLVSSLRSLYMASRMSDPGLLKMRELANGIVEDSIKSRNGAVVASVRTGLQIFLVLRAFTRNHYTGG